MIVGIFSMFLLVCFMVAGGVPVGKGDMTTVFYTPAFIITGFVFCLSILRECWLRRRSWKRLSFFITHLSLVAILLGCVIGMFTSIKSELSLKIGSDYVYRQVPSPEQEMKRDAMGRPIGNEDVKLGFGIAVNDFHVEHFPAEYDLFVQKEKVDRYGEKYMDYEFTETFPTKEGDLKFDNGTTVTVDQLKNSDTGKWNQQHVVEGAGILQLAPLRDKHYDAEIMLIKDEEGTDTELRTMQINYPIKYNGWKFYLISYDKQNNDYISIVARRDPGRILVVCGFWALMIGVAMMCFGANAVKGGRRES